MPDLLIELLSEEIPARMQARAAEDLRKGVTGGLIEAGLTYAHAGAFATPRRLALAVEGLPARSPDTREERKGPRADAPGKAVEGFLRSTGLAREDLETRDAGKGPVLFGVVEREGRPAEKIVAEVLERVIRDFPWPKSMRWGAGGLRWVRPLHRILCVLTDDEGHRVVPFELDGIAAGDLTEGHRFMAPGAFAVRGFEDYAAKLKAAHVVLSAQERQETIRHDATTLAFAQGLEVVEDPAVLSEVAGLVEWPVALMGEIEARFLDLPPEVLRVSMREHQKFFCLRAPRTGRIVRFVTVANRETADNGATILAGNQKVLAARLSDAAFFWENDLRVAEAGMAPWIEALGDVTFHARLGSQAERVARIAALAREIAPQVGADPDEAAQAAGVAKADLVSEMVGEFPELQGLMGRYYAAAAGLPGDVAAAVEEHYRPLGPSDRVPEAPVSIAVALADKIDTLTGFWSIGETPTGSKDPYALRRAALGVIRLVLERELRLPLGPVIRSAGTPSAQARLSDSLVRDVVQAAHARFIGDAPMEGDVSEALLAFLHDRLKVHLRERGVRHDVIDACLAMPQADDLTLLAGRAVALSDFLKTEDGENLLQGYKRASNLLTQAEDADGVEYSYGADVKFTETDEERALFAALDAAGPEIDRAMERQAFAEAMGHMAGLRAPIDAFFEAVQVNAESQIVRRNRLNLLSRIRRVCSGVADLTRVEG